MTRGIIETIIGIVAFAATFSIGYICWRRWPPTGAADGESARRGGAGLYASAPLFAGLAAGLAVLALFSDALLRGGKVYLSTPPLLVAGAVAIACAILMLGDWLSARLSTSRMPAWPIILVLELAAAVIVYAAGVRFDVISAGAEGARPLGSYAPLLTILWLFGATNIVKLLDGLEGAANVLLLVAAVAVFYVTFGTAEYFLNAFAVVVMGAVLASLRFHFYPARLPIAGSGTAMIGFLFAVLTVLSRQKTVTTLLLIFPAIVVVLLVGGAMFALLEKSLFVDERRRK